MSDEQFHEFHLDGKQMVFLFMASTVVAVVIFLCGVMVGRGVRANRGGETVEAAAATGSLADASAETSELAAATAPSTSADDPRGVDAGASAPEKLPVDEPPAPVDEASPLDKAPTDKAPIEKTPPSKTPPSQTPPSKTASSKAPVSKEPLSKVEEPPPAVVKQAPTTPEASKEPDGHGYHVQVATLQKRADADAAAADLKGKGYEAFVAPVPKGKTGFRVQVGTFKSYKDAVAVRQRLQKIQKYHDAWIPPR